MSCFLTRSESASTRASQKLHLCPRLNDIFPPSPQRFTVTFRSLGHRQEASLGIKSLDA